MRLNKYLSETGMCSRREADEWIAGGRVTINGRRAELGSQVAEGDEVRVNNRVVIQPGLVSYFTFRGRSGFTQEALPVPGADFTP